MAAFDHLVVSAGTLDQGAEWIAARLGVPLEPGGRHPTMGTHNRLLGLGPGEYLELIAIDPEAAKPGHRRWFALDDFAGPPRLTNWVCRVDDLDAALAVAPEGSGRATDLARGVFRWRMAVPDDGLLPFDAMFPGLIAWQGSNHPATGLPDRGCRLLALEISHPRAAALRLPLADARILVRVGPAALRATIATPGGVVEL